MIVNTLLRKAILVLFIPFIVADVSNLRNGGVKNIDILNRDLQDTSGIGLFAPAPGSAGTTTFQTPNTVPPVVSSTGRPGVIYSERDLSYTHELLPFSMSVQGQANRRDLGLSAYLQQRMDNLFGNVEEVVVDMSIEPTPGTSQVFFEGSARFRAEALVTQKVKMEEFHAVQAQALSDTQAINTYWAANPQIGILNVQEVQLYDVESNPRSPSKSGTQPWVIAVVVVAVVVVLAIIIFFMPRA